jgi:hypothetical protein
LAPAAASLYSATLLVHCAQSGSQNITSPFIEVVMNPHFVNWLTGLGRATGQPRRPGYRPNLDLLEDRLTPTLLKVAAIAGPASSNTFTTLSQAIAAAKSGDTIQIQAGAHPGSGIVTQDNLTIQGNPGAGSLGLQSTGALVGSITLLGNKDKLANLSVGTVVIGVGATGETIANSLVYGQGVAQTLGNGSDFAANGNNTISGCTFLNGANVKLGNLSGSALETAANDTVSNNVFWNPVASAITVQNETAGLAITGNRIEHSDPSSGQAFIMATDCVGTISGNAIHLVAAAGSAGILAQDSSVINTQTTNLTIASNVVTTNQTAIAIQRFSLTDSFAVSVTNNTLASSGIGLALTGNGAAGGNDYGKLTISGNDFRGFTGAAGNSAVVATDSNAFVAVAPSTANKVTAQGNIFSANNPQTLISTVNAAVTTIDISKPLTGTPAALTAMFQTLGGGPPTAAQLSALAKASPLAQAQAATTSSQAAKVFADDLFVSLLGRAPLAAEEQTWITNLTKGRWTQEQAIVSFVTSAEYVGKVTQSNGSPNRAWIASLFTNLLGRLGSGPEINDTLSKMSTIGKSGIAKIMVSSAEFRSNQVAAMYGAGNVGVLDAPNILKRKAPPSAADLKGWVSSTFDLRSIAARLLATNEFAQNG